MKNYNKFLAVKIIVLGLISFIASGNTNENCDTCISKKAGQNMVMIKKKDMSESNSSGLSLFELANMYEINLGGEPKQDLSPVIKEEQSTGIMSLREMIAQFGIKVL